MTPHWNANKPTSRGITMCIAVAVGLFWIGNRSIVAIDSGRIIGSGFVTPRSIAILSPKMKIVLIVFLGHGRVNFFKARITWAIKGRKIHLGDVLFDTLNKSRTRVIGKMGTRNGFSISCF